MDGLQADQTWLLLALQPLVLMSHESLKVYVQFCDSSCQLAVCCALPAVQQLHHWSHTDQTLKALRHGTLDLCLLQVSEG